MSIAQRAHFYQEIRIYSGMRGVGAIISGGNAAGLVCLDGRPLGETPAVTVLPREGCCYISLQPTEPRFYGVTRKLTFEDGRLLHCPPDVTVYDWGRLYELSLCCGALPAPAKKRFPFLVARIPFLSALAVLYYEDGLWLSLEQNGRVLSGHLLSDTAESGELVVTDRLLLAAAHGSRDVCVLFGEGLRRLSGIEADDIRIEDGVPLSTTMLDSVRGYELRTRWKIEDGALLPAGTEAGFFTRKPQACPVGLRFLEALLAGATEDAAALLSPKLGADVEKTRAFLGEFSYVRPHPTDRRVAGVGHAQDGIVPLRALTFETEGEQIVNILEEA